MERKVIHLNIADFGVAVERILDRALRTRALILASPAARAVVYDMSEEAYQDGVRKGMLLSQAQRRCRQATVLPPRPEQYQRVLQHCLSHARSYTPLVEQSSGNGHLFLDVTGTHRLFGPAPDIGWRLRNALRREFGLDPIWSLAPNKLVAKVASRLVKPSGEYIVAAGEEGSFLAPLPLHLLPGVRAEEQARLAELNIRLIGQAALLTRTDLGLICGQRAHCLYETLRGVDQEPVQTRDQSRRQLEEQHTFSPDTNQEAEVRSALARLTMNAGATLRRRSLGCRRVIVTLTYSDGITTSRQVLAKTPTNDDQPLIALSCTALYRAWRRRTRLRQLALHYDRLCRPAHQLSLFSTLDRQQQRTRQLSSAIDRIHTLLGHDLVQRGMQTPPIPPPA
jgi:DNA polymerase IV